MVQMEVCIWGIETAASVDVCLCIRGIYTRDSWNRVCCTFGCFQRSIWWQWLESPVKKYVSGGKDFWNRHSCYFDGRIRTRDNFCKAWTWIAKQETVAMIAIMSWNFKATKTPGIKTAATFDFRIRTGEHWWWKSKSAFGEQRLVHLFMFANAYEEYIPRIPGIGSAALFDVSRGVFGDNDWNLQWKDVSGGKDFWNRHSYHFDGRIRTR